MNTTFASIYAFKTIYSIANDEGFDLILHDKHSSRERFHGVTFGGFSSVGLKLHFTTVARELNGL